MTYFFPFLETSPPLQSCCFQLRVIEWFAKNKEKGKFCVQVVSCWSDLPKQRKGIFCNDRFLCQDQTAVDGSNVQLGLRTNHGREQKNSNKQTEPSRQGEDETNKQRSGGTSQICKIWMSHVVPVLSHPPKTSVLKKGTYLRFSEMLASVSLVFAIWSFTSLKCLPKLTCLF